ncbi:MAG: nucleotide exchange factor GrpE [bacterium]|nr:nucleotide exchange factor GrpE [bacterium]
MEEQQTDKLKQELEEYKRKADEYLNAWKRTAADFENYKKRREKEDSELARFMQEVTVIKILPTLESLEQALRHTPFDERFTKWSDGVVKIVKLLDATLLEIGVEKIKTVGEKFDPTLHEAVETKDSESESGIILEEVQSGYKLNNKLIRPAKVRVAK